MKKHYKKNEGYFFKLTRIVICPINFNKIIHAKKIHCYCEKKKKNYKKQKSQTFFESEPEKCFVRLILVKLSVNIFGKKNHGYREKKLKKKKIMDIFLKLTIIVVSPHLL